MKHMEQNNMTAVMSLLKHLYGDNWSTNVQFQDFANKYLQMEKEQITTAYLTGIMHPLEMEATKQAEQYYKETYGKQ